MGKKVCSRCNIEKEDSEYRLRFDKRGKGSKKLSYLNNTCKKCDTEISNTNYFAHKDDPEFLSKWKEKSRQYYHANREVIRQKMKEKRQTPEYKQMIRNYRLKNKEKIHQQESITKRRYHEKNKSEITDRYAYNLLRTQGLKINYEDTPSELLEIKKSEVLIHRLTN